ncbi:unnamed protein product [Caenorhabditis auriculariae]|uniref:MADF domain-containing protein n=1 Tax=Caenorhabditis auriculariae TaxID=2777116 RepID=A0A8S1H163_9PELO|nr:unnamed protein product [Caenorhabditis auriculariae]
MYNLKLLDINHQRHLILLVSQYTILWDNKNPDYGRPLAEKAWKQVKLQFEKKFFCSVCVYELKRCWRGLCMEYHWIMKNPWRDFIFIEDMAFLSSNPKSIPFSDLNEELRKTILSDDIFTPEPENNVEEIETLETLYRASLKLEKILPKLGDIRNDDLLDRTLLGFWRKEAKVAGSQSV